VGLFSVRVKLEWAAPDYQLSGPVSADSVAAHGHPARLTSCGNVHPVPPFNIHLAQYRGQITLGLQPSFTPKSKVLPSHIAETIDAVAQIHADHQKANEVFQFGAAQ
jgi:hypothetical protein